MLADKLNAHAIVGVLRSDVHKPSTFLHQLLDFIAAQLPEWKSRADRKRETSETILTSQLCAHLTSAARHSPGWDNLQFRVEETDEIEKRRKVDMAVSPSGTAITIEGRRHTDFDTLLPIECKRLPTPKGAKRDKREYVYSNKSSTGGIQRFKAGHHGANHRLAAMIGYVQADRCGIWKERVNGWIDSLADSENGWTASDRLELQAGEVVGQLTKLTSKHSRQQNMSDLELRHLWIEMN
jgi:hypothetical protein